MKDHLRDYATAAFRYYAQNGMSAEIYKKKIHDQAIQEIMRREVKVKNGTSRPTEEALIAAENAVNSVISDIKDIEAVELVLNEFKVAKDFPILQAVEIVYFSDANKLLRKGDINNRVHRACMVIPASERVVYKWLRQARQLFAQKRGLRM